MESVLLAFFTFPLLSMSVCNIGFDPDDWLDAFLQASLMKFDSAVHVAVIGQGKGFHAMVTCGSNQCRNCIDPIQKAVMAVDMKVAELIGYFRQRSSGCRFW